MVHDPYWDLENEPVEPDFDASKTALLIIDMQNMCGHPEGWMGRLCTDQGKPEKPEEHFFKELKSRVVDAYYTSEIGIKQELEYRGNTYQAEFSGVDVSRER